MGEARCGAAALLEPLGTSCDAVRRLPGGKLPSQLLSRLTSTLRVRRGYRGASGASCSFLRAFLGPPYPSGAARRTLRETLRADLRFPLTGDLSKPVYRHLAERKWRREELAILVSPALSSSSFAQSSKLIDLPPFGSQMQRVTQMSVTPDILPSISPVADLKISVGGEQLVPGVFTSPGAVSRVSFPAGRARVLTLSSRREKALRLRRRFITRRSVCTPCW